jgi:hypothetical protein
MTANRIPGWRVLMCGCLFAAACATAPKPVASAPRAKDSAPEKIAAQRAAAPHSVQLEAEDERWGFEAARERRRQQDAAKVNKAVDVTTPPAVPAR